MHDQILLSLVLNANFIDKSPSLVMAGQQAPTSEGNKHSD